MYIFMHWYTSPSLYNLITRYEWQRLICICNHIEQLNLLCWSSYFKKLDLTLWFMRKLLLFLFWFDSNVFIDYTLYIIILWKHGVFFGQNWNCMLPTDSQTYIYIYTYILYISWEWLSYLSKKTTFKCSYNLCRTADIFNHLLYIAMHST